MRKHFLLVLQLFAVAILVLWSTYLGVGQGFYERVSWWDIPAHVLGGLWAGLFYAWASLYLRRRFSILESIAFAFFVGSAWEIFESVNDIGGSQFMSYSTDTIKDLIDDSIGGALAGYVARKRL